jgi:autotransporter-associated beta strand protein
MNGAISGAAAITKTGVGTLTLATANTYSGNTNINAGILAINQNGALATYVNMLQNGATDQQILGIILSSIEVFTIRT